MRLDNTQLAISKTCEPPFNTHETSSANYVDLPTTDGFFVLPKLEKVSNAVRVGRNAPTHLCNTYWSPAAISLKDDVQTGVPGNLFRRALGGSVQDTPVVAVVYDHEFAILPPQVGDVLPSFNIISVLGLADYLLAGLMVDKIKFSQKNAERVQYEANIVGSGRFVNPSGFGKAMPDQSDTPCMDGYRTIVRYTDVDGSTVNLSALGTVSEWMVEHDNKIRTNRRRDGDPIQTLPTGGSGAYVRKMPRGKYETKGQIVLDFNDLSYWLKSVKNEQLTNLTFSVRGPKIATVNGVDYFHEFDIIVPLFGFDSPDTGEEEGDATTPIGIVCFEDPVTKGTLKGRIRNGVPTLV